MYYEESSNKQNIILLYINYIKYNYLNNNNNIILTNNIYGSLLSDVKCKLNCRFYYK